jgi:hypothetical protein
MKGEWVVRATFVGVGVAILVMSAGFVAQAPFATATWPWPDGRLSYLFIGSIGAALAMSFLWVGVTGELGVVAGGATTGVIMGGGMAGYLALQLGLGRASVLPNLVFLTAAAIVSAALFGWSRRVPIGDRRRMAPFLRFCFVTFAAVLFLAATALVLRIPNVFPWTLNPDSSVMFGWTFYGNASYFTYTLLRDRWNMAGAVLLSFLGYDLVLIPPFLKLFGGIVPEHRLSLIVYLAVLLFSAAVAIYYLAINPKTRVWTSTEAPTALRTLR